MNHNGVYIHGHNSRGDSHPMWAGGKSRTEDGYTLVRIDGKYVREHRLVMERHIGRKLLPNEHVHHKNHIPHDNRIDNLQILDIREHGRLEGKHSRGVPKMSARKIKNIGLFKKLYSDKSKSTKEISLLLGVTGTCLHDTARRIGIPVRLKTGNHEVRFSA